MTNYLYDFPDKVRGRLIGLKAQIDKLEKQQLLDLEHTRQTHQSELSALEYALKSSVRWRFGSFFVVNIKRLIHLIKNPLRFFNDKNYRIVEVLQIKKPKEDSRELSSASNGSNIASELHRNIGELLQLLNSNQKAMLRPSPENTSSKTLLAGAILDEISNACLKPEMEIITFRPDNWKERLEVNKPKLLLVESAWRGNMGSWQYKIAKQGNKMGDELLDLLEWTRNNGVPSIFWNKEDLKNFDRFIDKAKLFDYIFTSNENAIPLYQKHIKHSRIYSLTFAAQPKIHNPIVQAERNLNVCYAGIYHSDEYYERGNKMEILLKPAMDFDLHIYDPNFGATTLGSERFRFPDIYQKHIKGRLNYDKMLMTYRQYKVFLNANSVKESSSMFSRSVFELLACGTPVISTYSRGIYEMLGDAVLFTETEADTKNHLEELLTNNLRWMQTSVKGIRAVHSDHTYEKRIKYLMEKVGIEQEKQRHPRICILAYAEKPEQLRQLAESIKTQIYKPAFVVILSENKLPSNQIEDLSKRIFKTKVFNFEFTQNPLVSIISDANPADYYAVFQSMDYYSPNYLNDYALTTVYSNHLCIGKSSYYTTYNNGLSLLNQGTEFMLTQNVPLGSLMFRKDYLSSFNFLKLRNNDAVFSAFTPEILSTDPFNYIRNQNGSEIPHEYVIEVTC